MQNLSPALLPVVDDLQSGKRDISGRVEILGKEKLDLLLQRIDSLGRDVVQNVEEIHQFTYMKPMEIR